MTLRIVGHWGFALAWPTCACGPLKQKSSHSAFFFSPQVAPKVPKVEVVVVVVVVVDNLEQGACA